MLRNLHVKNLALIDETEVCFENGLNILSGETGAGKSIIIGSINLALGEKVPKELLREGADYSLVELVFEVDKKTEDALKKLEIFPEDGQVIMSRRISKGHSTAKINSETVTASKMKEVSGLLIDIHGQHEHQSLLQKKKHLEILDDYGKEQLAEKKKMLAEAYRLYKELYEQLKESDLDEEQRERELSFLEYEIKEIEDAELRTGEAEELEQEYRRLGHGKRIMEALNTAFHMTSTQEESATELVSRAYRELSSVSEYDEEVKSLSDQLSEIDLLVNDFNRDLGHYVDNADFDDEKFDEIGKRLDLINHLKSKYGSTTEKILEALDEKKTRAARLQEFDAYLEEIKGKTEKAKETLLTLSKEVSDIRRSLAGKLEVEVTAALVDLNFLDVKFEMEFGQTEHFTANGIDDAQFLISVNPGEPLRPLSKVASGGELSRIMLALKTVLADNDEIGTLIFDEIDTGISGRTAQAVSEKLNVIAKNHQVICITHLPQIAAMADTHFLIEKSVAQDTTISTIKELSEEETVGELARMIGGVRITDTVMNSAKEMKELAKSAK